MISRYSLSAAAAVVSSRFSVDATEAYAPRYNAAPTQLLPVITQESPMGLSFFYWGAQPVWANQKPLGERLINTRSEVIAEKTGLKKKLRSHRLIVPADGFYLWRRIGKKSSVPYRFTLPDKSPFAIPGLWEEYDDEHGTSHHTFTIITTAANESVAPFSERMPAILQPPVEKDWLQLSDEAALMLMLTPSPVAFDHYSVSSIVNSPERNDSRVIQPSPAADQFGNLTLFD